MKVRIGQLRGKLLPLGLGLVLGGALIFVLVRPKPMEEPAEPVAAADDDGPSPVAAEVYALIDHGERRAALARLAEYHEAAAARDVEALALNGALIVSEGEAMQRGKKYLENALQLAKNDRVRGLAHLFLGYAELAEEEGDMGERHLKEALRLDPANAAARFNLGRAYIKRGDFRMAAYQLELARAAAPDQWLPPIYHGRALAKLNLMERARLAFEEAVRLAPRRQLTHVYYAVFLYHVGEMDAAKWEMQSFPENDKQFELDHPPPFGFFQEKVNRGEYEAAYRQIMSVPPSE